jgi:CheY-like chemotaxis protein
MCFAWPPQARRAQRRFAPCTRADHLDGAGLVQAMRQSEGQRNVPIIIMGSMPEASVNARINGYAAFVPKPFPIAALVQLSLLSKSARPVS